MEVLAGGLAASAACVFTNPLEVVKNRLQLQAVLTACRFSFPLPFPIPESRSHFFKGQFCMPIVSRDNVIKYLHHPFNCLKR